MVYGMTSEYPGLTMTFLCSIKASRAALYARMQRPAASLDGSI